MRRKSNGSHRLRPMGTGSDVFPGWPVIEWCFPAPARRAIIPTRDPYVHFSRFSRSIG